MSDLRDRLEQLRRVQGLMTGSQWKTQAEELRTQRESGEFEVDRIIPGEVIGDSEDGFYLVRQEFELDTPQGHMTLGDALAAEACHIAFSAADDELVEFNPETAVFVDTETTGLAGGTGTVTFLVGAGYFQEGRFILDQCFMRDFHEEEAMLNYLRGVFSRSETLVSYNGKSFDLPLLRSRFITNRVPFHLDSLMHLDLVHASRRFWKKRLRNCSLGSIERNILGIERVGDIPGDEIPRRYLDYLRQRDARPLEPVFYHHRMDILSLVTLTAHLSHAVSQPDAGGFVHHEDRLSLLRLKFRRRLYAEVLELADVLLPEMNDDALRRECLETAGMAAKRLKDWFAAERHFRQLADEDPRNFLARRELAKIYEHRRRDLPLAIAVCEEGLCAIESGGPVYMGNPYAPDFRKRLERLRRRLGVENQTE